MPNGADKTIFADLSLYQLSFLLYIGWSSLKYVYSSTPPLCNEIDAQRKNIEVMENKVLC